MNSFLSELAQLTVSPLNSAIVDRINAAITTKHHAKGVCLLQSDQTDTEIRYVISGVVRGFHYEQEGEDIRDVTLWLASTNDIATDLGSVFLHKPSAAHIEVLEPTVMVTMSKKELDGLFADLPEMNEIGRKLLQKYVINMDHRLQILQTRDAHKRVELFNTHYGALNNRIPQKHIASFLNIHPVTLSKIRGEKK
jgi:CRP-like cAMP-binding protein